MKCRSCGYVSFEARELCPGCGRPAEGEPQDAPGGGPGAKPRRARRRRTSPPRPPEDPGGLRLAPEEEPPPPARAEPEQLLLPISGSLRLRRHGGEEDLAALVELAADENLPDVDAEEPAPVAAPGPEFTLEEDLIPPPLPGPEAHGGGRGASGRPEVFRLPYEEPAALPEAEAAIIDRDDEVPEQFWAAEGAGFGRRAAAAAIDGLLVGALLALFAAGAWVALRGAGLEAEALLGAPVLRAVLPPFGLLGLLLSLAYCVSFHAAGGRTPGKRLAGLELRTVDGRELSAPRCLLRWVAAALAAGAAGAGVLWGLFEPRRRGWADLLSGTVVAERRPGREPAP